MSTRIRRHVGQLIIAGFAGTSIPSELRVLANEFDLGGVILFARNIEEPEQVAELAYEVKNLSKELAAWVSVDQEGGRVARLKTPFNEWPPMRALGRSGNLRLAARFGRVLATELRAVGITLNYAPVLDVASNVANSVIGDRALSDNADKVSQFGVAIIQALQESGIACCGKHFPGHGDTDVDSHEELPVVEHSAKRLREIELVPFREAVAADVAALMTAHVLYPALDADLAATLSPAIVTSLLREEFGFQGLIATDDIEMAAITRTSTVPSATVQALAAGCDVVLLCGEDIEQQVAALEAVIRAVEAKDLPADRVEDSLDRQRRVKEQFLGWMKTWRPPTAKTLRDLLGGGEGAAVAEEMARYL